MCAYCLKEKPDHHNFIITGKDKAHSVGLFGRHSAYYFSTDIDYELILSQNEYSKTIIIAFAGNIINNFLGGCNNDIRTDLFSGDSTNGYVNMTAAMVDKVNALLNYKYSGTQQLYFLGAAYELLSMTVEQIGNEKLFKETAIADVAHMIQIRNLLLNDFSKDCPLMEDMAQKANMKPTRFKKIFKQLFKLPYYQYYQHYRLLAAKQSLALGKSVTETAHEYGFANPGHFTLAFKKKFKMLPSELQ